MYVANIGPHAMFHRQEQGRRRAGAGQEQGRSRAVAEQEQGRSRAGAEQEQGRSWAEPGQKQEPEITPHTKFHLN